MPIAAISCVAFLGIMLRPPAMRRLSLSLDMPSYLAAFFMSSFNPFLASVSSVMVLFDCGSAHTSYGNYVLVA